MPIRRRPRVSVSPTTRRRRGVTHSPRHVHVHVHVHQHERIGPSDGSRVRDAAGKFWQRAHACMRLARERSRRCVTTDERRARARIKRTAFSRPGRPAAVPARSLSLHATGVASSSSPAPLARSAYICKPGSVTPRKQQQAVSNLRSVDLLATESRSGRH